jgi:hypothetical protein
MKENEVSQINIINLDYTNNIQDQIMSEVDNPPSATRKNPLLRQQ